MAKFTKKRRFDDGGLTSTGATLKVVDTADQDTAKKKVKDQSYVSASGYGLKIPLHSSMKGATYPKSNESAKSDKQSSKVGKVSSKQGPALTLGKMGKPQGPNKPKVVDGGDTTNWSGPGNYSSLRKNSSGKTDLGGKGGAPVPKLKSTANVGNKPDRKTKIVGNWQNAAPASKPKSFQEAARRGESDSYTRDKMNSKLKPLFGRSKSATPKPKPTRKPLTQSAFAQLLQGQRKKP